MEADRAFLPLKANSKITMSNVYSRWLKIKLYLKTKVKHQLKNIIRWNVKQMNNKIGRNKQAALAYQNDDGEYWTLTCNRWKGRVSYHCYFPLFINVQISLCMWTFEDFVLHLAVDWSTRSDGKHLEMLYALCVAQFLLYWFQFYRAANDNCETFTLFYIQNIFVFHQFFKWSHRKIWQK